MKNKFDKGVLLEFLKRIDDVIDYQVTVISVGGTALGLFNAKPFSEDIDLAYITNRESAFDKCARETAAKLAIPEKDLHLFSSTEMAALTNIPDFANRAADFKGAAFKHINLKVMDLYDIIISKVKRFDRRDIKDLSTVLNQFEIREGWLDKRYDFVMRVYQDYKPDFIRNYQLFKKLYKHLLK